MALNLDNVVFIYCLTNTVNGKRYVGQTKNINRRMLAHRGKQEKCRVLKRAIGKYGWDAFQVTVLEIVAGRGESDRLEQLYIYDQQTLAPSGYNLMKGGQVNLPSEETRSRMSKAWDKRRRRGVSEETRRRMSDAHKRLWADPKYRSQRLAKRSKLKVRMTRSEAAKLRWANRSVGEKEEVLRRLRLASQARNKEAA